MDKRIRQAQFNAAGFATCLFVIAAEGIALLTGQHGPWTFSLWGF